MIFNKSIITILICTTTACNAQKTTENHLTKIMHKHTNKLANESSPYLLQHAHNPVNWLPWSEEALSKAKNEDKPILVSIGYAACHWCHVMEHESFENEDVASIMNEHFVCIKVDREERPDIDHIYMGALQAMGQQGGWPLNVFLTSEAKPFYGGTYFPPANWMKICENVSEAYKTRREEINDSADKITQGISGSQLDRLNVTKLSKFKIETLEVAFNELIKSFDNKNGGFGGAPKFPMPCNYSFLMHYYNLTKDEKALEMVNKTLTEMAWGGIYDQIGGGFARYSTDARWFAPHFEKMLYDNGQLVSIYSLAYQITNNLLYKDVVNETVDFTLRELTSNEGGFYSSLDADSEGVEGKFYCWSEEELKKLIGDEFELFKAYYNTTPNGNWEHMNILYRNKSEEEFCEKNKINLTDLKSKVENWKVILLKERTNRIRPGLDDKILASWNGLMLKGLCDAYKAFGNEKFLIAAKRNADFIISKMIVNDKLLHNYKNGNATIDGYLEDYAIVSQGLTSLYQITFDEKYLQVSKELTDYTIDNFYDQKEEMFYFTDSNSEKLIARKKELFDNVIPSSNSIMADNLHVLGLYFDNSNYQEISKKMSLKIGGILDKNIRYTGNWAKVYSKKVNHTAEIAIVGYNWKAKLADLQQLFMPNTIFMGGGKESNFIPLLEGKTGGSNSTIYVCYNKTCQLPVENVNEAIKQIK